jgi:hypothetical protein
VFLFPLHYFSFINLYSLINSGNLAVRNVAEFAKKEYFVLDSEYLETLVVAVPKYDLTFIDSNLINFFLFLFLFLFFF